MKYEKEILKAFKNLGFKPRTGQVEGVNQILVEFLDKGKTDVCLVAPTGSGKSIIGAVVPEALSLVLGFKNDLKSVIGMHQNSLVEQYGDTFKGNENVLQIKGAGNYKCGVMDGTAEHCVSSSIHMMTGGNSLRDLHCEKCEFAKLKSKRNAVPHLVTNFYFIFIDRMLADILEPRLCYVWDEAHTLNDVFTDHNAIYVSAGRLRSFIEDIAPYQIDVEVNPIVMKLLMKLEGGRVNDSNYLEFITELGKAYTKTKEFFEAEMERALYLQDLGKFKHHGAMFKKYGNLCCKISDLLIYKYKHVFDYNPELKEFVIKAVFMGSMFDIIRNSKYNLFMSATLSKEYLNTTMKLNPATTAYIKLPSQFPKENKTVLFVEPMLTLNYKTMQEKSTIDSIYKSTLSIIKFHHANGENGIVLMPSFKVCEVICEKLRKNAINVFEHKRGEKIGDVLNRFKKSKLPAVLVSPSIFEGIDLPDDASRFQIITKVPWPSLGDKRMKVIADEHPEVYQAVTLHKLVQGLGRSIRNEEDYATSYILDAHGYRLLTDKKNIWFDEFDMKSIELK